MAIKRFTGKYYTPEGDEKNIVASAFGVPTTLDPNAVPAGFAAQLTGGNINISEYIGNFYDPNEIEYYYNTSAQVKMSERLKGNFESIDDMANALKTKISSLIGTHNITSYNISEEFNVSSKKQALWYNTPDNTTAPVVFWRCQWSHTINPGDLTETFTIWLAGGVRPCIWSDANDCWGEFSPNNYNQEFVTLNIYQAVSFADLTLGINQFFNCFTHMYAVPAKHCTVSNNVTTGYATGFGNSGYFVLFNNTVPQVGTQYPKLIWSGQSAPWDYITWEQSGGDLEPTDPGTEPDPYEPIGPRPEEPGPTDPTDPDDPPGSPSLPPIGGTSLGFFKAYNPSIQNLRDIASKLWDPNAWDAIKQMFTNPMEAIYGLAIVPVQPSAPTSENVYLGRYNTQVSVPRIDSDYVSVDCGSLYIKKFFGSYLDYDPYTKYSLYLPYIGDVDLNADEITGHSIGIQYHCNVITGDCVAFVLLNNKVIYTANGNMIRQMPLSQTDYSTVINTVTQIAATALTAGVAGAGAAATGEAIAAAGTDVETGELSGSASIRLAGNQARQQSNAANLGSSSINSVMGTKLAYKHSGRIGEGAGQLSVQKPFITVTRPNLTLPEGHDSGPSSSLKRFTGYPVNKVGYLSDFHGLTIVEACQLSSQHATEGEILEALEIMKGGVIL